MFNYCLDLEGYFLILHFLKTSGLGSISFWISFGSIISVMLRLQWQPRFQPRLVAMGPRWCEEIGSARVWPLTSRSWWSNCGCGQVRSSNEVGSISKGWSPVPWEHRGHRPQLPTLARTLPHLPTRLPSSIPWPHWPLEFPPVGPILRHACPGWGSCPSLFA